MLNKTGYFLLILTLMGCSQLFADSTKIDRESLKKFNLVSNNNIPLKVIVAVQSSNLVFVKKLTRVLQEINQSGKFPVIKLHMIADSSRTRNSIISSYIKPNHFEGWVEINDKFYTSDIWMQDWGEIGIGWVKGQSEGKITILDSNRGRGSRGLAGLPKLLAKMWDCYYIKNPSSQKIKGDYGGNIELTPDNILVIGDSSSSGLRDFLAEKGYKNKTIVLESSWLGVGHVDEYLSFIPNPNAAGGYTIVKADPALALKMVREASEADFNEIGPSRDNQLFNAYEYKTLLKGIKDGSEQSFIDINVKVAEIIERNVELLKKSITKMTNGKHKEFSVLSFPAFYKGSISSWGGGGLSRCVAYLPGVVNMLVLQNHLIIPDCYFPLFNRHIEESTGEIGLKTHFIDDMRYHQSHGEIHCGTNVFRDPKKYYVTPEYLQRRARIRRIFRALQKPE